MKGLRLCVDLAGRPLGEEDISWASSTHRPSAIRVQTPDAREIVVIADARFDQRHELARSLAVDTMASDAELISWAFLRWGEGCPTALLGDFAFIVWDGARGHLLCARDLVGIKPLHYARTGSRLLIASRVDDLLHHPALAQDLDSTTIGAYLCGMDPDPDRTFFAAIRKLPPGHRLTATPEQGVRIQRYWHPPGIQWDRSEEESRGLLRETLDDAVGDRVRGESAPVGVALSGGLDSTTIAAVATAWLGPSSSRVFGCSFLFDRLGECDERLLIGEMSAHLGLDVELIEAERFPFLEDDEAYTPSRESPALSWEGAFREMLRRVKVRGGRLLLTGHGADDLFRGSSRVYADRLRRGDLRSAVETLRHSRARGKGARWIYRFLLAPLLPQPVEHGLRKAFGRGERPEVPLWVHPELARSTGLQARMMSLSQRRGRTARQDLETGLLVHPSFLRGVEWYDRNASPVGVEVRHPFLDRRLIELVLTTPPQHLYRLGTSKPLLRSAVQGLLPDAVRLRPDKVRLGAFVDYSLREKAVSKVEALIAKPVGADLGFLDAQGLREAFQSYRAGGPEDLHRAIWYAITLELWLRRRLGMNGSRSEHTTGAERAA